MFRQANAFKIVLSFVLLMLLSSCGFGFFCSTQSFEYTNVVPVFLQPDEIAKIESLAPQQLLSLGKLYLHDELVLINEVDKGVHIFDNTDPAKPVNVAFIAIPGNHDLLVRQDESKRVLYADNYMNLLAIDITNPKEIVVLKTIKDVFGHFYPQPVDNPEGIVVDYVEGPVKIETFRNCGGGVATPEVAPPSAPTTDGGASVGGSLARFSAIEDFLYTIDENAIQSFRIETLENPVIFNRTSVDFGIETLFPYKHEDGQRLYVGGQQGMYIMDASDTSNLKPLGKIDHIQSCDPVVVQDNLAYVTLQGSCFNQSNRLEIIDVTNPKEPFVIEEYTLQEPFGLGIDDNYLFICDGEAGLKVYENARVPEDLKLFKQFDEVKARDIIPYQGNAIVIAKNGFFQYDYSNIAQGEMTLLSSILIELPDTPDTPDEPPTPEPVPMPGN